MREAERKQGEASRKKTKREEQKAAREAGDEKALQRHQREAWVRDAKRLRGSGPAPSGTLQQLIDAFNNNRGNREWPNILLMIPPAIDSPEWAGYCNFRVQLKEEVEKFNKQYVSKEGTYACLGALGDKRLGIRTLRRRADELAQNTRNADVLAHHNRAQWEAIGKPESLPFSTFVEQFVNEADYERLRQKYGRKPSPDCPFPTFAIQPRMVVELLPTSTQEMYTGCTGATLQVRMPYLGARY